MFLPSDRGKLNFIIRLLMQLNMKESMAMATLDDILTEMAAMEDEVKVASDTLKQLAANQSDPAAAAKTQAVADRLTAAHDALKAAVDSSVASGAVVAAPPTT